MDGWILAAGAAWLLAFGGLIWLVLGYRRLARRRARARASWTRIDTQLRRRHDLVPRLVETVNGYAGPDRDALEAVVAAHAGAVAATRSGPAARARAEERLTVSLDRLFALVDVDAYRELRADATFATLRGQLCAADDQVAYVRQFYNTAVQAYVRAAQSVPTRLVTRVGGLRPPELFDATPDPLAG
ncbi:MAG: LemA family protein [Micromonosporaceae bacterium]